MIFLENIEFLKDHLMFKKGEILNLNRNIVLLVGDQGVGKSTLLRLLRKTNEIIKGKVSTGKVETCSFDSEKDNPRVKGHISTLAQIGSIFSSHGQVILHAITVTKDLKNTLVLLDEPESGLSIRSQILITNHFQKLIENNNQLIVATHSSIIMEGIGEVYDLKNRKFSKAKEFIDSQKD